MTGEPPSTPAGPSLIVFLGPDGCGKTTILRQVATRLEARAGVKLKIVERTFRFGVLPSLRSLLGREASPEIPEGTRYGGMREPLGQAHCLALALWYGIDAVLGRFVMWRNEGAIFLFARFFYDFYYQLGYRKAFVPALDLLAALGPRPDKIIVLKRDPAEIFRQKPELSEAEITEQYRLIRCRLSDWSGYAEIDASQGIEATTDKVLELILS